MSTIPIPPARSRAKPRRKPRKARAQIIAPEPVVFDEQETTTDVAQVATVLPAEVGDGEAQETRRYVAVVSEIGGTEAFPAQDIAPSPPELRRREADAYPTDIPIALAGALLAGCAFLPWYKGPRGFAVSVTGWASGTLGPVVVFLAAGSLALVLLRRLRVGMSLPVDESIAHEAVGWLSLVATVVKIYVRPSPPGLTLTASYGAWIGLFAAAALIVFAGVMSPRAPLVFRPGWQRGRAGTMGVIVLGIVIAGAAVFGATNSPTLTADIAPDSAFFPGTVRGRLPNCAKAFPMPPGLKPETGYDTGSACQAQLSSTQRTAALVDAFKQVLKTKGWVFTEVKGAPGSSVFTITRPRCATLAVVPAEGGSLIALAFTACPSPTPTAG